MRLGSVTKTPAADGVTYRGSEGGWCRWMVVPAGRRDCRRRPSLPPWWRIHRRIGASLSTFLAGAGFALVLLPLLPGRARASSALRPVGAVVMPPWTGLALSGASMQTRGAADPLSARESLASTARLYAGGRDPRTATWLGCRRSEFTWAKTNSLRYSARIESVSGTVHSWEGMPRVFPSSIALLQARQQILGDVDPTGRLTKRSAGRIEGLR